MHQTALSVLYLEGNVLLDFVVPLNLQTLLIAVLL